MKSARVVHLELHTGNLGRPCAFFRPLLGWRPERVQTSAGTYHALDLGKIGGGVVECETDRSLWLPYVEVPDVHGTTDHARELGAEVLVEPREGPAGWRSVVSAPEGVEVAFWQPKR